MTDIAYLVAPIPGGPPQGIDLRIDPAGIQSLGVLKSAFRDALRAERAMHAWLADPDRPKISPASPNWAGVEKLAREVLAGQSKDLEVAGWLIEALVRSEGFAGLADGAALLSELVEGYWNELYPVPEPVAGQDVPAESPVAARLRPVGDVVERLVSVVRTAVLFKTADGKPWSFFDCDEAKAWRSMTPAQQSVIRREARTENTELLGTLFGELTAALTNWQALDRALRARAGEESITIAPLTGLLQRMHRFIAPLAPPVSLAAPLVDVPGPVEDTASGAAALAQPGMGALASREDALRALGVIAEFFRRTEPVSPLAYTLEDAMRRARMSWPELLTEIVPDLAARKDILTRLGIAPPDVSKSGG